MEWPDLFGPTGGSRTAGTAASTTLRSYLEDLQQWPALGRTGLAWSDQFGATGRSNDTAGPSSSRAQTYLQALMSGAYKGSTNLEGIHSGSSDDDDKILFNYPEGEDEELEDEEPAPGPANVLLAVPAAAHAEERYDNPAVMNANEVPWLPIAGSRINVPKRYQTRKAGLVMTNEGLGYYVYGTYGPNGVEY